MIFQSSDEIEEGLYEKVATEIKNNYIHQGLWLKATVDSNGNDLAAKQLYAKYRVKQLARIIYEENRERQSASMKRTASIIVAWFGEVIFHAILVSYIIFFLVITASDLPLWPTIILGFISFAIATAIRMVIRWIAKKIDRESAENTITRIKNRFKNGKHKGEML